MNTNNILDRVIDIGIDLALAAGVFVLGYLVVRYGIVRWMRRLMLRYGVDEVFVRFVANITSILLMTIVLIVALEVVGVNTGYLIAGLVVVLITLVAAMNEWLQNVAGGLWMFLNNPFKLDDLVSIAGHKGKVEEIQLLTTKLRTNDNLEIILPNRTIVSSVIINYHAKDIRRINMVVEIGYDDDIRRASEVLRKIVTADERVLPEPAPRIAVNELGANGVKLNVRPWVKKEEYDDTRYDLLEKIKYRLDEEGITMPYPQLEVHTQAEN